jgi:hypothetical protein
MKIRQILPFVAAGVALVLASCGSGGGVTLGAFPALTKTEGDAPFALAAPQSASPATFVFSSSDPKVATVSDNKVTVILAGTTTITAAQPSMGSFNPTSTSAVLTVVARVCVAPTVRDNGLCVQPCTAPAVRVNGACVAPALTAGYVTKGAQRWMPATFASNWDSANAFCSNSTIDGLTGWRLPTEFDLTGLYSSGAMNGQGWLLDKTWSLTSAGAADSGGHAAVNLSTGVSSGESKDNGANVTCVR